MYIPGNFQQSDQDKILQLIRDFSFVTLLTFAERPTANHLPLMIDEDSEQLTLLGHMARANDQWRQFKQGEVLVIVQGPHAYISPTLYHQPGVPTWNYAVLHLYGKARVITEEQRLIEIIKAQTDQYEQGPNPWQFSFRPAALDAIVGFEIMIDEIQAKFKLSQNRDVQDRAKVMEHLQGQAGNAALLKLMQENEAG